MSAYVSRIVRRFVIERAGNRCEYCRIPRAVSNFEFYVTA